MPVLDEVVVIDLEGQEAEGRGGERGDDGGAGDPVEAAAHVVHAAGRLVHAAHADVDLQQAHSQRQEHRVRQPHAPGSTNHAFFRPRL